MQGNKPTRNGGRACRRESGPKARTGGANLQNRKSRLGRSFKSIGASHRQSRQRFHAGWTQSRHGYVADYLAKRHRVVEAAVLPQSILTTGEFEWRFRSKIAFKNLGIVADKLDDVIGPII